MQPASLKIKIDADSSVDVSLNEVKSSSNKQFVVINGHNYYLKAQGSSSSLALFHLDFVHFLAASSERAFLQLNKFLGRGEKPLPSKFITLEFGSL